jgi:beta-N-acetylhexosaminidase
VDKRPAGYSPYWIQTILRQKLVYQGTIFSDDLGMYAAKVSGSLVDRVRDSLLAGCDAVLVCKPGDVRQLLANCVGLSVDADLALKRLKGRLTVTRDELESVAEWRQWKKSIKQLELEQSTWL